MSVGRCSNVGAANLIVKVVRFATAVVVLVAMAADVAISSERVVVEVVTVLLSCL